MPKWYDWVFNPIGAIGTTIQNKLGKEEGKSEADALGMSLDDFNEMNSESQGASLGDDIKDFVKGVWNDLTGKSQIEMQNEFNRQMAEDEYQRNLQSIGDTASAYEAAGFNRNMVYGSGNGSPVQYSAPQLQAYTGSKVLDTFLSRAGQLLKFIPAMYQATAAMEGIDQAREKTAQAQMKTTAMGLDIVDRANRLDRDFLGKPYDIDVPFWQTKGVRGRLGFSNIRTDSVYRHGRVDDSRFDNLYKSYLGAAERRQMSLLEAIDLKNKLTSARTSLLGTQQYLDQRYGGAGRVVGMASQALNSGANLLKSVGSLSKPKSKPYKGQVYYPDNYYDYMGYGYQIYH